MARDKARRRGHEGGAGQHRVLQKATGDAEEPPRFTLRERARYRFDATMSRGSSALVGWLAVATLILIVVVSAVVLLLGLAPKSDGHSPGVIRQLFNTLLHSLDPGTIAGDSGKWPFLVVMLVLTLAGLFIVSALIGVIATGLDNKLLELRKGRSVVVETNHTVILGWSAAIFTILSELSIAAESEKHASVVVLADQDKVEMEDAIREQLPDLRTTKVVCRTGTAIDLGDLRIVNAAQAKSIIVLSPDDDPEPDAHVIKTVLALTRGPHASPDTPIVAEIRDPSNLEAARLVGGDQTVLVDKRDTVARLIVQTSRQSGASVVYQELFDFDGDEIYFREDPALVGHTFAEALQAYEECSVIGIEHADGTVKLNPPPATLVEAGARVIAVASDDSVLEHALPSVGVVDESAIVHHGQTPEPPTHTLVIGWNDRSAVVLSELDQYVAAGSTAHVLAGHDEGSIPGGLERLDVTRQTGPTTDRATLDALDITRFDHVMVMCPADDLDPQRADARTLVTLLHLRDILGEDNPDGPSIVSEMLDDRNRALAQVTKVDDVIVSDQVLSLILAQISENPALGAVFGDLLDADGSEVYLRPVGDYVKVGHEVTFATVVAAASPRAEAAIGLRILAEKGNESGGVVVNPSKSYSFVPEAGDRVVVLAED
jgi:voltage-gated potassium channel Kch